MTTSAGSIRRQGFRPPASGPLVVRLLPSVLVILSAAAMRSRLLLHDDIYWLLTLGARLLAGARPYVDFIEVNPPASIILYLPAVWIGNLVGISPESVTTFLVFLAVIASVIWSGSLLLSTGILDGRDATVLAPLALAWLLIVPGDTFAQREHVALVCVLPMLCTFVIRWRGGRVALSVAIVAGSAGGVAVAIKPYFALPLLFALGVVVADKFRWRKAIASIFLPENLAAAAVASVYLVSCYLFFPAFFTETLPLVLNLYVPFGLSAESMILSYSTLFMAAGLFLVLLTGARRLRSHPTLVFVAAATGFAVADYIQSKGFPYQSMPAVLLLMFSALWFIVERFRDKGQAIPTQERRRAVLAALYLGCLIGDLFFFGFSFHEPKFYGGVARIAPLHPKIAGISESLRGPQLARLLRGTWVEGVPSSWIGMYAAGWGADGRYRYPTLDGLRRSAIAGYGRMDRDLFVRAITIGKPDVIFVDPVKFAQKRLADAAVVRAMKDYHISEVDGGVTLWVRNRPLPAQSSYRSITPNVR